MTGSHVLSCLEGDQSRGAVSTTRRMGVHPPMMITWVASILRPHRTTAGQRRKTLCGVAAIVNGF